MAGEDCLVFISHITEEAELAIALRDYLSSLPYLTEDNIFVSSDSIEAGQRWFSKIENALRTARIALILCSKASVKRPWINFEVGACLIKDIRVVPVCHTDLKYDDLPTPLNIRQAKCLSAPDLADIVQSIADAIEKKPPRKAELGKNQNFTDMLEKAREFERAYGTANEPNIITDPLERTLLIVRDLETLAELYRQGQPYVEEQPERSIWFSGTLSAFAINPQGPFQSEAYKEALLREKQANLELAQLGFPVRCIITPPHPNFFFPVSPESIRYRIDCLLDFLKSGCPCLSNIWWAVSYNKQKTFYIIGNISCFEGYKRGGEETYRKGRGSGYWLTLRQTDEATVTAYRNLYKQLFERLERETIVRFACRPETAEQYSEEDSDQEILRKATIYELEQSKKYVDSLLT